jgi:hypothetical protein
VHIDRNQYEKSIPEYSYHSLLERGQCFSVLPNQERRPLSNILARFHRKSAMKMRVPSETQNWKKKEMADLIVHT